MPVIIRSLEDPSQHLTQDGIKDLCCSAPCNPQKHRPIEHSRAGCVLQGQVSLQIKYKPPVAGALLVSPTCLTLPFSKPGYCNDYLKQITLLAFYKKCKLLIFFFILRAIPLIMINSSDICVTVEGNVLGILQQFDINHCPLSIN